MWQFLVVFFKSFTTVPLTTEVINVNYYFIICGHAECLSLRVCACVCIPKLVMWMNSAVTLLTACCSGSFQMEREGGSEGEEWWEKESTTRKGRERGTSEEERKEGEREREELRAVLRGKEETRQTGSEIREKKTLVGCKGIICQEC